MQERLIRLAGRMATRMGDAAQRMQIERTTVNQIREEDTVGE